MPIHDWTRVPAGLFHHFHQDWSIEIARALNRGLLPEGVAALVEQRAGPRESDVLAIERQNPKSPREGAAGGLATEEPSTQIVRRHARASYAARANRIAIRHHLGRLVAVIEIVSPGNKDSRSALRDFVEKSVEFIEAGVHVLIVDLFPPTSRDPAGVHKQIWDEFIDEVFALPPDRDRVLASYKAGIERVAYLELLGIGDSLPSMPLFLTHHAHIKVPLEATYQTTWEAAPADLRDAVLTGKLPEQEGA